MTLKQIQEEFKKKVNDTIELLKQNKYALIERHHGSQIFFYKQINPQIGVSIACSNAKNKRGLPDKHYNQYCFDLFLYNTNTITSWCCEDSALPFWIPNFNPYNHKHIAILNELNNETEIDVAVLDKKYQQLLKIDL